jgi:hypothetical protein
VELKGQSLSVAPKGGSFKVAAVRKISVSAGAGNDRIELKNVKAVDPGRRAGQ